MTIDSAALRPPADLGPIQAGDLVLAHLAACEHRRGATPAGSYAVMGTAYLPDPEEPGTVYVGTDLVMHRGRLAFDLITATVTSPGQAPRVITQDRDR